VTSGGEISVNEYPNVAAHQVMGGANQTVRKNDKGALMMGSIRGSGKKNQRGVWLVGFW